MISPILHTRLRKTATDNGFELEQPAHEDWLGFASSQTPLCVWLSADAEQRLLVAVSQQNVADELASFAYPSPQAAPPGALGVLCAKDVPELNRLLRRVFQLSLTLPDELLYRFERIVKDRPNTTEVERLTVQRVGQELFRTALLNYWHGRCALTGLAVPELLRASHIKPWAACETDAERLDVHNGILLAPHLDALFDKGFMTFGDDGEVIVSKALGAQAVAVLGLENLERLKGLREEHARYLVWHRERVFRRG